MGSISQVTNDRARHVEQLRFDDGKTSQWLHASPYRSCFCIAKQAVASTWLIEGLLPDGQQIELGSYDTSLFDPPSPRYITVNAMCGLPIRFVAATSQPNSQLWIVFKA